MSEIETEEQARKKLRESAQGELEELSLLLTRVSGSSGCELLLRKAHSSREASWFDAALEADFSVDYRKLISESIQDASTLDVDLLEYEAVIAQSMIGVAYAAEIAPFLDQVPSHSKAKKFKGSKGDFQSFNQRAVRIKLEGGNEVVGFGPSSIKDLASFDKSKTAAIFSSSREVMRAPTGILSIGTKISFFVYKNKVFVVNNDSFASMTGFREVVQKRARVALQKILNLAFLNFSDPQQLEELVSSKSLFARKLSASDARGLFDRVSREHLLENLPRFSELNHEDDGTVITLNPDWTNPSDRKDVLHLLSQTFVNCALTGDAMLASNLRPAK